MAAFSGSDRSGLAREDEHRSPANAERLPEELLAPVIAGAFARGVAQTFDLLGVPALFLDREGHVLFANAAAGHRLKGDLRIRSRHLLAVTRAENELLSGFLVATLRDAGDRRAVTLPRSGVTLHALPLPAGATAPDQLLRAIVVIDDGRHPALRDLLAQPDAS